MTRAAIATDLAAQDLRPATRCKRNIEDEQHNTTRFIVLSRREEMGRARQGKLVTSFVFQVRNIPAALYKALGGFATNGVNMTKLESYMVGGSFFGDAILCRRRRPSRRPRAGIGARRTRLRVPAKSLRIMGVYPAHPFRKTLG